MTAPPSSPKPKPRLAKDGDISHFSFNILLRAHFLTDICRATRSSGHSKLQRPHASSAISVITKRYEPPQLRPFNGCSGEDLIRSLSMFPAHFSAGTKDLIDDADKRAVLVCVRAPSHLWRHDIGGIHRGLAKRHGYYTHTYCTFPRYESRQLRGFNNDPSSSASLCAHRRFCFSSKRCFFP